MIPTPFIPISAESVADIELKQLKFADYNNAVLQWNKKTLKYEFNNGQRVPLVKASMDFNIGDSSFEGEGEQDA